MKKTFRVSFTSDRDDRTPMHPQRVSRLEEATSYAAAAQQAKRRVFHQGVQDALPLFIDVQEWQLQSGKASPRRDEVMRFGVEHYVVII